MLNLRRNILIFHQAALGDFVVTWHIAMALGRMFPQSRVMYVTAQSKGKLAERVLGTETIDVETGWHVLHGPKPDLNDRNRSLLTGAHTIVSFVSTSGDLWEDNVRSFNPQATLIQLNTKPTDDQTRDHVAEALVRQLKRWPAIQSAAAQMLNSIQSRGLSIKRSSDAIVIHPGAGKPEKCWPAEKFVKLAEQLNRDGKTVRMLLGEVELEKWPAGAIQAVASAGQLRKPATYLDLLAEISQASVFIGNDSGPGHLAGVIGVPSIALFGSSAYRWQPLGPAVRVIEKDAISKISVNDVHALISEMLTSQKPAAVVSGEQDE